MKANHITFFLFFFIFCHTNAQNIRYVKENGTGNGTSWTDASNDIQSMINDVHPQGGEVWVAEGTYMPEHKIVEQYADGTPTNSRIKTFFLGDNVKLYGGFPTNGNPAFADRDWEKHTTILSGDIGKQNYLLDNCYTIITISTERGTTVIDGFTIIGAKDGVDGGTYYIGGNNFNTLNGSGINAMVRAPGNIFIENNIITSNTTKNRGGGIRLWTRGNVRADIISNIFSNNSATSSTIGLGGGIEFSSSMGEDLQYSTINIVKNSFIGNQSRGGGAIYGSIYRGYITNNIFSNNKATFSRGGALNLYCIDDGIVEVSDNIISDNEANYGGGICISNSGQVTVERNSIYNNNSRIDGGGIYLSSSRSAEINNNDIHNNSSGNQGGGIYTIISLNENKNYTDITSNIIRENSATNSGGGIYSTINNYKQNNGAINLVNNLVLENNSGNGGGVGAVVYGDTILDKDNINFINNTISNNTSDSNGGGIFLNTTGVVTLNNCIVYGNSGTDVYQDIESPGLFIIKHSLVGTYQHVNNITNSQNNNIINKKPLFVSDEDFHLNRESPCIGAGSITFFKEGNIPDLSGIKTDIEGNRRIRDNQIDIGAYQNSFPSIVDLLSITVNGIEATKKMDSETEYEVTIDFTENVIIEAVSYNPTSIISGDIGNKPVVIGSNIFEIIVESSDNTERKIFSLEIAVTKRNQSITFPPIENKKVGDLDFSTNAAASSGLDLSFLISDTTVATIANDLIHIKKEGSTIITAIQNGNDEYSVAIPVSQTLIITGNASVLNIIESHIKLYPNPVKNTLNIKSDFIIENITIYDIYGKKTRKISDNVSEIDLSDLSNGIYIIELHNSIGKLLYKIIKE